LQALVLCLDISDSTAYGEPAKLNQAIGSIHKVLQELSPDVPTALVTFDVAAEILLDLKPLQQEETRDALTRTVSRGVTCIAAGLAEATNMIEKTGREGEVLLLTDGRANLSQNRMGGFEGSLDLEAELLAITREASGKGVAINVVAVGEDAFTHTLSAISRDGKGGYWLADDFQGFTAGSPPSLKVLRSVGLRVHGAPAELPSAQPTWTKESQFMHVAVVSQSLYEAYQTHHRAFLVNPGNGREARTALISIESQVLAGYRERRPRTAESVRAEEALLLDRSYRGFLALDEDAIVRLTVY